MRLNNTRSYISRSHAKVGAVSSKVTVGWTLAVVDDLQVRIPLAAPGLYPLVAVVRPTLNSFCAQMSAASATGSVLPGIVTQPFFAIMPLRS